MLENIFINNINNNNQNENNQINNNNNNNIIEALNWDISNPSTYLNIANDYFQLKEFKKALTYSIHFLKFYPNNSDAFILKAKCYMKLYQHGKSIVIFK